MATNLDKLRDRLEHVNTQLNLIEEGWPHRPRTDRKIHPLTFECRPSRVPHKHQAVVYEHGLRLARGLIGWEVTVHLDAFTGQQAGCVINVFVNGQSPGRAGCQVYNFDLKNKSTSFTPSLRECVRLWPGEVDRLIKRFESYPDEDFKSNHYRHFYKERQRLNTLWHKLAPMCMPYPHGQHKPGYPEFNP